MKKIFSKSIKSISKIGIKNAITEYFNDKTFAYNNKYICILPKIPFTSNSKKHVKFFKSDKSTPLMSIIYIKDKTQIDITFDIYKLIYGSKKASLFYNFHNKIYDFYDWYINLFALSNENLDTLMNLSSSEQSHLIYNCNFNNIYELLFENNLEFNDIIDMNIEHIISEINRFKHFIFNYEKYKKLNTLEIL